MTTLRPSPTSRVAPSFESVTESPGLRASNEQLVMLRTRYELARESAGSGDVLEVACGTGIGLGYLRETATAVVASDIHQVNLEIARATYEHHVPTPDGLLRHAAEALPFRDDCFDTVVLLEAIYYLEDAAAFVIEAQRVLRPGGRLVICSVNCEWTGFNPSPFSTTYFGAEALERLLYSNGFAPVTWLAFEEDRGSLRGRSLRAIKMLAVRLGLIPRTMRGKTFLKRLVFGPTTELPAVLTPAIGEPAMGTLLSDIGAARVSRYKVIYVIGATPRCPT